MQIIQYTLIQYHLKNSNNNNPIERFHSSLLENIQVLKLQNSNTPIKLLVQIVPFNLEQTILNEIKNILNKNAYNKRQTPLNNYLRYAEYS